MSPGPADEAAYRPRVKICGVTSVEETALAVDLGADFIGLNFYPPSPRYVSPEKASDIVHRVGSRPGSRPVRWVGVFVNMPVPEAVALGERVGLDLWQFHGDESPDELAPVAAKAIKAFRVKDRLDATVLRDWLDLSLWAL